MKTDLTGYDRESFLDMAILAGGGMECLFEVAESNGLCVTDNVSIGHNYDVSGVMTVVRECVRILEADGVRPATEASGEDMAACPYGGVGLMGIEIDFEVS